MENPLKFCKANIKQIDEENGVIPFTLTTFAVDRDGDVINPAGGILENFRKNPLLLFMHNPFEVPPGRVIPDSIRSNTQEMTADVKFDIESDPFAKFLFEKYKTGTLNAGSIRFIPKEFDREVVLDGQTGFFIKVWELIEFSLVTIPANPEALRKEFKDGKQGLYETHEKPYYEAIERFWKYHNRELEIDKQIFPFCTGKGCEDVSRETEKDDCTCKKEKEYKPDYLNEIYGVLEMLFTDVEKTLEVVKNMEFEIESLKSNNKGNNRIDTKELQLFLDDPDKYMKGANDA